MEEWLRSKFELGSGLKGRENQSKVAAVKNYRRNVAALLLNSNGQLLVCERLDHPGAWQFPQGGVDEGEAAEDAILREIGEEVGLWPAHYRIEESRTGYRYDYPPEVRRAKPAHKADFAGQEQTYFLCRVRSGAPEVDLTREPREFSQARWIAPKDFDFEWVPDFKKEVYRRVLRDFFGVLESG